MRLRCGSRAENPVPLAVQLTNEIGYDEDVALEPALYLWQVSAEPEPEQPERAPSPEPEPEPEPEPKPEPTALYLWQVRTRTRTRARARTRTLTLTCVVVPVAARPEERLTRAQVPAPLLAHPLLRPLLVLAIRLDQVRRQGEEVERARAPGRALVAQTLEPDP